MSCSSDAFRSVMRCMLGVVATSLAAALGSAGADGQDLQVKINAAVHRGRAALLPRLAAQVDGLPKDYPMGRIALSLAACLKSEVPTGNEVVKRALERLETLRLNETYSMACYLFALDAYWQARYRESLASGRSGRPGEAAVPRVPPDGPIRKKMESLIEALVRGQGGTWTYSNRAPGDLSNSQFAVLGLEIGLENEVPIPSEVFHAVAEHLVKAHRTTGDPVPVNITYRTPAWEGITSGITRVAGFRVAPGGWNYSSSPTAAPSITMTAAGVSSLLVARRALGQYGAYTGELAQEVDRQIEAGLAWMGPAIPSYMGNYYGMYSLEKVGDIGSIQAFGPTDWYVEGARWLVRAQKADGTWGDEVNTAFALLFLTRATRSHLQTQGPPVVLTRGSGEAAGSKDEESDLVYVGRLKGFISASTLFGFLGETRDPALIPLVEEAVKAFPPHRVHEVLAFLLGLWSEENDAVTRFARSEVEAAAELKLAEPRKGERAELERLARSLARLRDLERQGQATGEEAAKILAGARSPLLARRTLDLIDRLGLVDAFPEVIERVAGLEPGLRRKARELLVKWTGESIAPAPDKAPPEEHARPWRVWWAQHGAAFVATRRASRLIEDLDRARDPGAVDAAVAALAKLGPGAVPAILQIMDRGEYSIHLVRALGAVTGKSAGVRPDDWRKELGTAPTSLDRN